MEKLEVVDEAWDIKKILVFVVIAVLLGFSFKTFVLDQNVSQFSKAKSVEVEGVSDFSPSEDLQQNLQTKFNDLKEEVNNLNVVDIATSTPSVQKILNDFKNLQNLPQSQAKEACFNICSGL
ncbi:MAG: hypothetical protein Q8O84_00550 [Nanoarchaeota archaeon]|nr:hypothetical protein [Nanoarchaeota archaeon]